MRDIATYLNFYFKKPTHSRAPAKIYFSGKIGFSYKHLSYAIYLPLMAGILSIQSRIFLHLSCFVLYSCLKELTTLPTILFSHFLKNFHLNDDDIIPPSLIMRTQDNSLPQISEKRVKLIISDGIRVIVLTKMPPELSSFCSKNTKMLPSCSFAKVKKSAQPHNHRPISLLLNTCRSKICKRRSTTFITLLETH